MTRKEFEKQQEASFDSFCKTIIRNEARDAFKELALRAKHEGSWEDLSNEALARVTWEDSYQLTDTHFLVRGKDIYVHDPDLSDALRQLAPQRREVILLSFFLDMNDTEIGQLLKINADSVGYRRKIALKHLHEFMERLQDE